MKHQLHQLPSLAVLVCLLALSGGLGRAQQPVAQQLDVYAGETKILPIDGAIDSFTVAPDNIVKVDKADTAVNQLNIVALAGGTAVLTIKSGGRTLIYDLAVSPAPVRLYINLNESQRVSFPNTIDDFSLSQQGIVRVVQPDTTDKVLLLEANTAGKTTLTVYSNKEIYRYFISTFENRGADVLEIQNAFSAKGYRSLTITFDKDQAIIGGTVPTQEELDDAVRIVKQYTQFVQVKAQLGQAVEQSEFTEQESIIINNIQRIANVKGLTVRVKFPMPSVHTTSTSTKQIGDYIEPPVTTTPQGGTVRGGGFRPPTDTQQQQNPNNTGPTEAKPLENVTETITTNLDTTIPEKIFLYGDMQDDLDEAKVIRVARTFCPFIVNFLTVKDPIQIRTQIRFMQITNQQNKDTGFAWTGNGPEGGPAITLGFGNTAFSYGGLMPAAAGASIANFLSYGISGAVSASAQLELFESLGVAKLVRESQLFLTNGQPGWYSEGEVKSYIAGTSIAASSPPIVTATASSIFLGVNLDISPLNVVQAGGKEPDAQKVLGIPASIGVGSAGYTLDQDNGLTADKVSQAGVIQQTGGGKPYIDNTVKYVDENGLIGMNISAQLTIPNGAFQKVPFGDQGQFLTLPDVFVRTTRTRVNLRDGQTVTINGLIDDEVSRNITSVPFLSKIPIFSAFFKNPIDSKTHEEVIVLVTPHIVRMRDPDSSRYPKPRYPELEDMARQYGDIPIIKPVRYDVKGIDIRPETPKEMNDSKDAKSDNAPSEPLAPHASGGMENLQPAATTTTSAVDKKPESPTISQHPSVAPLAPSSTLP